MDMKTKKKKSSKSAGGRPTKYRESYCQELENHMEAGGSFFSFGAVVRVNETTLYSWLDKYEQFHQSKCLGELLALKFYEDFSRAQMTGQLRRVKQEITKPDGSKVREYTPVRGDSKTWGITMRARFRKFGYANQLEVTGKDGGPVRTKELSEMSDAEIQKELDELEKVGL